MAQTIQTEIGGGLFKIEPAAPYTDDYNTLPEIARQEKALNEGGKLSCRAIKPVLFEMPSSEYLCTGDVIGKCMSFDKEADI